MNNPFEHALKRLNPEERKMYEDLGKEMYGHINYAKSEVITKTEAPNAEITVYIQEGLKSGLHPNDLSDAEFKHMFKEEGKFWTKYGYSDEDINMREQAPLQVSAEDVMSGSESKNKMSSAERKFRFNRKK